MVKNPRPNLTRTVMCRNAEAGVYCVYREIHGDCWFAHDPQELRCVAFARSGVCTNAYCTRTHVPLAGCPEVVEAGRKPGTDAVSYVHPLPNFRLPPALVAIVPRDPAAVRNARVVAARVCHQEYLAQGCTAQEGDTGTLSVLQMAEQLGTLIDLASFTMERVTMQPEGHHRYTDLFRLAVPGLAENRPSVLRGDSIDVYLYQTGKWVRGSVHFVQLDHIVVSMPRWFNAWEPLNVTFTVSPVQDNMRHRAIRASGQFFLNSVRVQEETTIAIELPRASKKRPPAHGLTPEQQRAVDMMLQPTAPRGVMVWGPPGTGKTTTVVGAIAAVCRQVPTSRILVVCPSNEAADLLVERIHAALNLSIETMLRVNAMQRAAAGVSPTVLQFSLLDAQGGFSFPQLTTVLEKRIVVTTMMTAGRLYGIGVPPKQFDFLFADEAGHSTEADFLVTLQLAPSAKRIMLAGDHKQLGAVVRSTFAVARGMGRSPLQRLIENPSLAERCVMLTHNFRSHASIVDVVNVVYNDRLIAASTQPSCLGSLDGRGQPLHLQITVDKFQRTATLSAKQRALFIHHTGPERREADSPSWMNLTEAHMAVELVVHLWKDHKVPFGDSVILTPYRKQAQKVGAILHNKFQTPQLERYMRENIRGKLTAPVQVSTVEMFQGREARVIIVSCVRNMKDADLIRDDIRYNIGFVKQEQRANVAISRARDLLIVLGNAALLAEDPLWEQYLSRMVVLDSSSSGRSCGELPVWQHYGNCAAAAEYAKLIHDAQGMAAGHEERPFEREH